MFGKKKKQEEAIGAEDTTSQKDDIQEFEDGGEEMETEAKPKKKKLPGWVIIPILAALILIAVAASLLSGKSEKAAPITVTAVEKGDVKEVYDITGALESEKTKTFYSPVSAPITSCSAKVGTVVKANAVMVTYDLKDLEKNNTESQLNLQSAQATNQGSKEQAAKAADSASQATADAQNQLNSQIASAQNQLDTARSQAAQLWAAAEAEDAAVQADRAQVDAANEEIKAYNNPLEAEIDVNTKLIPQLQVQKENADRILANFDALNPTMDTDEKAAERDVLVKSANKANQSIADKNQRNRELHAGLKQYAEYSATGGQSAQAAAAADQQVAGLEATLNEMQGQSVPSNTTDTGITNGQQKSMNIAENLAELSVMSVQELIQKGRDGVKAEFDGIISDVKATEGAATTQGMELFTLVSNKDVALKINVPSGDFDKLKVGNKATITVGQKTYNGTLSSIDKIAVKNEKGNPVVGAKIHIDNPDDDIVIGVSAKAKLNIAETKNVLKVPNEVVNTGTSGDFVYVIEQGTVKKQDVELGIASNNEVEIKSGLKAGDQVVSDGTSDLKEGMKATAVEAAGSK